MAPIKRSNLHKSSGAHDDGPAVTRTGGWRRPNIAALAARTTQRLLARLPSMPHQPIPRRPPRKGARHI